MSLGIFFVAWAILYFEVISVRTMSFVLGSGYVYFVISLALLGMGSAASIMSVITRMPTPRTRAKLLLGACILLASLLIVNLFATVLIKHYINAGVEAAGSLQGLQGIVLSIISGRLWAALVLGVVMSLPYFIFGAIVTLVFNTSPREDFHKLYFADLVGAALGCVTAVLAMEFASFAVTALLPVTISIWAGILFCGKVISRRGRSSVFALSIVIFAAAIPPLSQHMEPSPELNSLARDYTMREQVEELWRGWNSFSRVSALRVTDEAGNISHVMALGNGEGHATLVPYKPDGYGDWRQRAAVIATASGVPKDALVIFAGTGADMLALDYYAEQSSNITGVELNHTMIAGARSLPEFRLEEFYGRDNINLMVEEGRVFLERDTGKYDVIVLSWSGATTSYYSGSIGHSTQYLYTREAMESLFDHLKPDGRIVIWNTNKVNSLAMMRSIMEERGLSDPPNAAVVLHLPGAIVAKWDRGWDSNPLIIKPSGFDKSEIEHLVAAGSRIGLEPAYTPIFQNHPYYWPYSMVLTHENLDESLALLTEKTNLRFGIVTDDRPFSLDLFRTRNYLSPEFWSSLTGPAFENAADNYRAQQVMFVIAIVLATLVLVLGPVLMRGGPPVNMLTFWNFLYFFALGAGFILVEIALMQKLGLLLGSPGLSIGIVLAAIILFAGIGSRISEMTFRAGLSYVHCVAFILFYLSIFLWLGDSAIHSMLGWPLLGKIFVIVAFISPLAIVMGHLFPQGLASVSNSHRTFVPWAWAINGVISTVAAGVAPLIAQAAGFNFVIIAGMLAYALVVLLPPFRPGTSKRVLA